MATCRPKQATATYSDMVSIGRKYGRQGGGGATSDPVSKTNVNKIPILAWLYGMTEKTTENKHRVMTWHNGYEKIHRYRYCITEYYGYHRDALDADLSNIRKL